MTSLVNGNQDLVCELPALSVNSIMNEIHFSTVSFLIQILRKSGKKLSSSRKARSELIAVKNIIKLIYSEF